MTNTGRMLSALAIAMMIISAGCATTTVAPPTAEKKEVVRESLTPEEHMRLGSIYEQKGETELALREYERLVEADRYNPDAFFVMANLQLKMSRFDEAESNYKKAIELAPGTGPYHNNLGWLYMEQGRLDKAAAEVKRAIDVDPDRRYVYLDTLGVVQTRQGRFAEAEESLKVAEALTPRTETEGLGYIYNHLVDLYFETGETAKEAAAKERLKALGGAPQ